MNEVYQEKLRERMKEAIAAWSGNELPSEQTVHRFFRSLRGTAGTLGVTGTAETAERLMDLYSEDRTEKLTDEEVHALISQLRLLVIDHAYPPQQATLSERTEGQTFVLLVNADLECASGMKELLETQGCHVVVALSARKGLDLFYTIRPDFVVVDLELSDMNGFELLQKIATRAQKSFTPITVLDSDKQKSHQIRAFELGASDYMVKPIDPDIFLPYFRNRLSHKNEVQRMVIMDDLTGAYNRRYLKSVVPEHITAYQNKRDASAFVLLDLDNFKRINDTYGHAAGDAVLREFAQAVKDSIREQDGLFRFGGEEFALILPSTTKEAAREIVLRIRAAFAKYRFTVGNDTFTVTFSAGITETRMNNLHTEKLTDEADQALYYAKEQGRDRICIYDPDIMGLSNEKVLEIILLDNDPLTRAILTRQIAEHSSNHYTIQLRTYREQNEFLASHWYRPERHYFFLVAGAAAKFDCLQIINQIRSSHPSDRIFISVLSAREDRTNVAEALEQGADDHLLKPLRADDLLLRINRLMEY